MKSKYLIFCCFKIATQHGITVLHELKLTVSQSRPTSLLCWSKQYQVQSLILQYIYH